MAERLGRGLQNLLHRFNSGSRLHFLNYNYFFLLIFGSEFQRILSGGMAERFKAAVLKTVVRFTRTGGSNPSPSAIFLPPSDSLNQSQFAHQSLKPVDTKGFTKHIAVCLKHTQTPGSDRFCPIFAPPDSEF